jgi:uncharacterized membrane protein required for colicin V production
LRNTTSLDGLIVLLVAIFSLRGLFRGTIGQVFSLLGFITGLWGAGWVAQWVGQHWQSARPAVVFLGLRWLVAALAGLAIATLFQWWGTSLGGAVKKSPFGWLDRLGGMLLGAGLGLVVASLVMLGALLTTWPHGVGRTAARSWSAVPLMAGGAGLCSLGDRYFPGSDWLRQRYLKAGRRARSQSGRL